MARLMFGCLYAFLLAAPLGAQVVETPVPFDSAGRVTIITPPIAARLELRPPAWRITGDYREARLYAVGEENFVIVVQRPSGQLERYPISREEREILRQRTNTLPAGFVEDIGERATESGRQAAREFRNNAFVRNQTILGLIAYAPAFSAAITDDNAGAVASYLLAAGATFFGALQISRAYEISRAQEFLSTEMGLKGSLIGLGTSFALDGGEDANGAAAFVGGIGGAALGLYFGNYMDAARAKAMSFGSNAAAITAAGIITAFDAEEHDVGSREAVAGLVAAAVAGYPLGAAYPVRARYNVTSGDLMTLYTSGGIGALLALLPAVAFDADEAVRWWAATGGFVGGIVLGDRLFVRRYDHSAGEGNLIALGALAGGLMGSGIYVLIDRERDNSGVALALGTAGAIGGVLLTEQYVRPRADAGPQYSRIRFTPGGLALAGMGVHGNHPILSIDF